MTAVSHLQNNRHTLKPQSLQKMSVGKELQAKNQHLSPLSLPPHSSLPSRSRCSFSTSSHNNENKHEFPCTSLGRPLDSLIQNDSRTGVLGEQCFAVNEAIHEFIVTASLLFSRRMPSLFTWNLHETAMLQSSSTALFAVINTCLLYPFKDSHRISDTVRTHTRGWINRLCECCWLSEKQSEWLVYAEGEGMHWEQLGTGGVTELRGITWG